MGLPRKEMAIHSRTIAWKIPWTEEPGRLAHRVAKSQTRLSDFTFTFTFQVALVVKNPHANAGDARDMGLIPGLGRSPGGGNGTPLQYILAWKIQWAEESGRLQSMGPQRVRHD